MLKSPKKTIFKMFLIPMAVVTLIQALVTYGAVYLGGMSARLDEYAVGTMKQIVRNRSLILENNMIHRWSDIDKEAEMATAVLTSILQERNLNLNGFFNDNDAKEELLREMLAPGILNLRRTGVNGYYLVLADGMYGDEKEKKCTGFYFRDTDSEANPQDYSDILMERGSAKLSQELGIPFDVLWSAKFRFQEEGAAAADNFFYKPYRAAAENPDASAVNLAYWSGAFTLEGNRIEDSYQMISYSLPLMTENGQVYGVLGIEISMDVLEKLLPQEELNSSGQSGYFLAQHDGEGNLIPFFISGTALTRSIKIQEPLLFTNTNYDGLYKLTLHDTEEFQYYADFVQFDLYNTNTPFESMGLVLAGVQEDDSLFGMGSRMMQKVLLGICCSVLVGMVSVYFLLTHLTRPIRELAVWIRNIKNTSFETLSHTQIMEIKDLYSAVQEMYENQKKAENQVIEEKERYLLALQSNTEIIYTYYAEDDSMHLYNLAAKEEGGQEEICIYQMKENIDHDSRMFYNDRQLVKQAFTKLDDHFKIQFRRQLDEGDECQWIELSGKTIRDKKGKKSRVIGSIRNINEEKLKEQQETKAAMLDAVTGLYREDLGPILIKQEVEISRKGILLILDLDKFKEMNEQYGIAFGDAVLEEMGRFILKFQEEKSEWRILASRIGGDEILIWFGEMGKEDVETCMKRLNNLLSDFSQGGDTEITFTAVAIIMNAAKDSFNQMMAQFGSALEYCKKWHTGRVTYGDDLPEEVLQAGRKVRKYNEVASRGYEKPLNMVTRAFNLFDKGGRVGPVISVLFAKLGIEYHAKDIHLTELRADFNTSAVTKQWHLNEEPLSSEIQHFTDEELEGLRAKFQNGYIRFGKKNGLSQRERIFLHVTEDIPGICIPMYDSGALMGAVIFVKKSGQDMWNETQCDELQEIVKIIETNINRERYDLASRAKSEFLSRMSHEIRTPMNAIIGMTSIALGSQREPERVVDCLYKIDQSSKYLLNLINDILDMSKIESGKMKLAPDIGSLEGLSVEISSLMGTQIHKKKIQYHEHIEVDHKTVIADFMRLKQVIINLMSNAVKFTPENGCITFTIREESAGIFFFSVEDTGIGIGEESKEKIFHSFEQADGTIAANFGGTGLGLSISSRLIHLMGGAIGLSSQKGKGSCFYFTLKLPLADSRTESPVQLSGDRQWDFKGIKVLLVEDNEMNTEIARTLLEMQGMTVETAENGKIGVEKFSESSAGEYQLILMDIRMPVMDGLEAARTIRQMKRQDAAAVPIIAMTANAFDEDMKKSIESGMNGHLAKPIDVKMLMNMIGEVLTYM